MLSVLVHNTKKTQMPGHQKTLSFSCRLLTVLLLDSNDQTLKTADYEHIPSKSVGLAALIPLRNSGQN